MILYVHEYLFHKLININYLLKLQFKYYQYLSNSLLKELFSKRRIHSWQRSSLGPKTDKLTFVYWNLRLSNEQEQNDEYEDSDDEYGKKK